jgi:hypothetical protein
LSGCGLVEIDLPDSVEIVGSEAFRSEDFRIMKVGEKSRLNMIEREFQRLPRRFFLITPEQRLSLSRRQLGVKLSNQCARRKASEFPMMCWSYAMPAVPLDFV